MFHIRVKEVADQQGITQSRLSRLADVDPKVIRKIYQSPTKSISLYILDRIAQALHVPIQDLIESIEEEPQSKEGQE